MKKYVFELALLIGLSFTLLVSALAKEEQADISQKLIRLHIIANSDSGEDQRIKLEVRDRILEYMQSIDSDLENKSQTEAFARENLGRFESIANEVCKENGVPYRAKASLSRLRFPTKAYDSFSLPAGEYDALRIQLGTSRGRNWWCVLFPPLCLSSAECEIDFEKTGLSEKELLLLTSERPEYRIKFKIIELIDALSI